MKELTLKKTVLIILSVLMSLTFVLALHIYIVTRQKVPTSDTRIMARMDFKSSLDSAHSVAITELLYKQKGVDHVLYNPSSKILVYTFCPAYNNASNIYAVIQQSFPSYQPVRVLPSSSEIESGCPVVSEKPASAILNFFKGL